MSKVEYIGSSFEGLSKTPPDGVQDLVGSWLGQLLPLSETTISYRVIEKAKGRPTMERIHLQGVRNERFVNARAKPDVGGNDNCWIISIPIPRDIETDEFVENLLIAANRVNGWTETELEERQMRMLHSLVRGDAVQTDRLKESTAIEAGFPSLDWLSTALVALAAKGRFVRNAGNGVFEWDRDFDTAIRKNLQPPSEPPQRRTDPITEFVYLLGPDGIAAIELLGELPSIASGDDQPIIRIPSSFPLPEDEREAFFIKAENIKLLKAVGENGHGVQEQVWELDLAVFEDVNEILEDLGLISYQPETDSEYDEPLPEPVPVVKSPPQQDTTTSHFSPTPPKPSVSEIRERLSAEKAVRASSSAERAELQKQYEETVFSITESARTINELQRQVKDLNIQLNDLHRMRSSLKTRVKAAGKQHHDACVATKRLSRELQLLENEATEQAASSVADLLREESRRTGVPLDRLMATLRQKLRS